MSIPVAGFEWDDGNRAHCRKHGVSSAEIEGIFAKPLIVLPDDKHSQTESRIRAIGRTGSGRFVFVVFTIRAHGSVNTIRPISARYMHRKEIDAYEKENPRL